MPKVVDVEQRRADIARACWQVIVREGIAGVTTRHLAAEAGIGTGVLFHYFRNKEAVIAAAFELLAESLREHLRADIGRANTSLERLRIIALTNLPLPAERVDEFGVWLSMWAHTFTSNPLRTRQQEYYQGARDMLVGLVRDAVADGELREDLDPELAAAQLIALTDGFIVQLLIDRGNSALTELAVRAVDDLLEHWTVRAHVSSP